MKLEPSIERNNMDIKTANVKTNRPLSKDQKDLILLGGMSSVGGIVGGIAGYNKYKNPVLGNGAVDDTFVRNTLKNYIDKNSNSTFREKFSQVAKVLKNLKSIKTSDELKTLLQDNGQILQELSGDGLDNLYINSINPSNYKKNIKNIRKVLESKINSELLKIKGYINLAWDGNLKTFVKKDNFVSDEVFNVIKDTKYNSYYKKSIKYAGVSALLTGVLTVGSKIIYDIIKTQKNHNNYLQ